MSALIYYKKFNYQDKISFTYYTNESDELILIDYPKSKKRFIPNKILKNSLLKEKKSSLVESTFKNYFSRKSKKLELAFKIMGGTTFQKKVWQRILKIPYGQVKSYQEIALEINSPLAVRAVGSAVGSNPLSILIACHRVLNKDKNRVGHYGGGGKIKAYLLHLEGIKLK